MSEPRTPALTAARQAMVSRPLRWFDILPKRDFALSRFFDHVSGTGSIHGNDQVMEGWVVREDGFWVGIWFAKARFELANVTRMPVPLPAGGLLPGTALLALGLWRRAHQGRLS
jgi:hypothetical protein